MKDNKGHKYLWKNAKKKSSTGTVGHRDDVSAAAEPDLSHASTLYQCSLSNHKQMRNLSIYIVSDCFSHWGQLHF